MGIWSVSFIVALAVLACVSGSSDTQETNDALQLIRVFNGNTFQRNRTALVQQLLDVLMQVTRRNKNLEIASNKANEQKEVLRNENDRLKDKLIAYITDDRSSVGMRELLNVSLEHERCLAELKNTKRSKTVLQGLYDKCHKAKYPASCKAWHELGYAGNGVYMIDPDGPGGVGPFQVECQMNTQNSEAITIMHHDSEARINAGNCEASKSCVRNVVYSATLLQIIAAISVSSECKQFIKYDCRHSHFHSGNDPVDRQDWYSRDGTAMASWGGAPPGSRKCACGVAGNCHGSGLKCNCDANDPVWRSDSGYITDRDVLPVTKMAFGDLGNDGEDGFHTLGALECYG